MVCSLERLADTPGKPVNKRAEGSTDEYHLSSLATKHLGTEGKAGPQHQPPCSLPCVWARQRSHLARRDPEDSQEEREWNEESASAYQPSCPEASWAGSEELGRRLTMP